jgi:Protein of unknown function (DUF3631)
MVVKPLPDLQGGDVRMMQANNGSMPYNGSFRNDAQDHDAREWTSCDREQSQKPEDPFRGPSDPNITDCSDPANNELRQALEMVIAFLERYIVFSRRAHGIVIALWVAHTRVVDAFDYTPYLQISSPVKGCGKSKLFDCLRRLCARPWLVVSATEATLFRKIEHDCPTLLLDELDKMSDEKLESVTAILNAGFERQAIVPRCLGNNHTLREFGVFCPKAFAGISNGKLPDTVADRSLPIVMARRRRDQTREKFRAREAEPIAGPIRTALEAWSKDPSTISSLRDARPTIPEQLGDRAADICEPLLAIADLAGGRWPTIARAALLELCTGEKAEECTAIMLLWAIREIFDESGETHISTEELVRKLVNRDSGEPWGSLWGRDIDSGNVRGPGAKIARILKPFGIVPGTIRNRQQVSTGYKRESFEDAFSRYLPP